MSLQYNKSLIPRAKELRKDMTPQEKHLWYDFLCNFPLRFQRQKTIDSFIVDFYCYQAKLAIELDGSQHYTDEGFAYDTERTAILSTYGVAIIRFSNTDINNNFLAVCQHIEAMVKQRTLPPSPSGDTSLEEGGKEKGSLLEGAVSVAD